jgi:hypothetical protein
MVIDSANDNDLFGASVVIHDDGKIIAVGSPGHDVGDNIDAGAVTAYEYEAAYDTWLQMQNKMVGTSTLGTFWFLFGNF